MARVFRVSLLFMVVATAAACQDAPLESLGQRSSDWVNEPTIVTTTTVPVTIPLIVESEVLKWFNDDLGQEFLSDPAFLKTTIFERRAGDLFVQSSRAEIAAILPALEFPTSAPHLAEYVTSQLIFDTSGELSVDPVVAFGIWSAEPYTRSRSVAQMAVLRVSQDEEAAAEVAALESEVSCARFADRATRSCEIVEINESPFWSLTVDNGYTMIWFQGIYRYELFGRSFVPVDALQQMVTGTVRLSELEPVAR